MENACPAKGRLVKAIKLTTFDGVNVTLPKGESISIEERYDADEGRYLIAKSGSYSFPLMASDYVRLVPDEKAS